MFVFLEETFISEVFQDYFINFYQQYAMKNVEKIFSGHIFLGICTAQSVRKKVRCSTYNLTFTKNINSISQSLLCVL